MRSRSATTFGRDAELRRLLELAELARSGSATSVLVHGEAGIGKTRLVSELVTALRARGDLVVVGHGVHLSEGEVPFGVLAESLRDLVRSVGVARVREVLGTDAEQLASLVPTLRGRERVEADRARIIGATADLVEALASERLLCWLVEDLQWTDAPTRDAFTYLTRFLTSARLLTVATWRDEDDGESRPGDLAETVGLVRLGPNDAGGLVAEVAPDLAPADRRRVVELSQGLPFLVEELADSWRPGTGIDPAYLRRLVLTRLPELSLPARELVELATLGEGHLDVRLLEDGLGIDPAAIREAAAAGLLDAEPGAETLRFRHALLREAIAEAIPPGDRRRLHRRWAEAMDDDDRALSPSARSTALATHWHEARVAEHALPALAEVARVAGRLPAPTAEHGALVKVLDWWDQVPDAAGLTGMTRERVLTRIVDLGMTVAAFEQVHLLLQSETERVHPTDDPIGTAWLGLRLAVFDDNFRRAEPRAALVEVLVDGDLDDPRVVDGLILTATFTPPGHLDARVIERLERVRDVASDPAARLSATFRLNIVDQVGGQFDVTLAKLRSKRAPEGATLMDEWLLACHEAWLLILLGRAAEAATVLEHQLGRLSRPSTVSQGYQLLAENLAHAYVSTGRWDEALELAGAALEVIPELDDDEPVMLPSDSLRSHIIVVQAGRGDLASARRTSLPVVGHAGPAPWSDRIPSAHILASLASLSAAEGDLDRCRMELAPAWQLAPDASLSEQLPSAVLAALRAESSLVGRHDPRAVAESAALVERIMAAAEPLTRPGPRGGAWWAEASAHAARSRGGDSAAGWAAAVAGWRECDQPYDVATCLRHLGEATLGDGDATTATEALAEAYEICERLGAKPLADQVVEVARRGRLPVGPAAVSAGPGPLTPRETEVLGLVAEGRSNGQIAAELFMSPKTVSVHVSRILAKLAAANRTEAAATGRRLGLVD